MEWEELNAEKELLIERLGVHIEKKDNIPPLAARIVSTLILTGKRGSTFDELVTSLQASKSTISTHLNNLQHLKTITYYTICGDRKKYFVMNPKSMIIHMGETLDTWDNEKQLHVSIMEYKQQINQINPENEDLHFDLEFHLDYLQYLEQASDSLRKIREKLTAKTNNE
ncbi:GbsR/MarR family transcriptional regulator [Leeuwenhoekiella marinoflava]|uniref:DNA-binding transcriptional regulator GbsR (MarR family) n=2 Tax=Leeuwenhoekiella marinoflava TaxID=988 RepID=A0A4Q0PR13_9FLAO|nr:transcriptional regulator [Leeuwenhoekiella marinoflava]RXG33080.1 DNA-binding transcriptional regulator GbsR (MarR family) [Leeuwenhoekiella marinoflava]SHE37783.1 DNA-binding transcriptional regulator GbsR, MarR family [Leeuwenhoekiella marinoflava DSM 3653]